MTEGFLYLKQIDSIKENPDVKKKLPVIFFILIFVVGLSLLLYPTVSDWSNKNHQSHAMAEYHSAVEGLSEEERKALWAAAEDYNRRLYAMYHGEPISEEELQAEYPELLNIYGNGMMGIIEIPKIKVRLPLRHGTSEPVLQDSIGHIETSSLPVGGANTHCVVSGHTGLPSARLFTDLEQMEVGDTFTLEVLSVRMTYTVDQILVVLPWQAESLGIEAGMDYCTLITCTPYGVNSHRLLVRGVHTTDSYVEKEKTVAAPVTVNPETPDTELAWWLRDEKLPIYVAVGAVGLLILLLIIADIGKRRSIRKKKRKQEAEAAARAAEEAARAAEEAAAEASAAPPEAETPTTGEPIPEEPTTEKSSPEEPTTGEPIPEEPTTEEPNPGEPDQT